MFGRIDAVLLQILLHKRNELTEYSVTETKTTKIGDEEST